LEVEGLRNYLPGLSWNHDSLNLCFPSGWYHRCEPLVPSEVVVLRVQKTKLLEVELKSGEVCKRSIRPVFLYRKNIYYWNYCITIVAEWKLVDWNCFINCL
jgi:hypothetical protein